MAKVYVIALLAVTLLSAVADAQDAPEARQYLDWAMANVKSLEVEMPTLAAAAEAATVRLAETKKLCVRGDLGLSRELGGRAGGFAVCQRGEPGAGGDVILYALGIATADKPDAGKLLDEQLADADALTAQHAIVIGIASRQQLEHYGKLDAAKKACSFLLDNHAPTDSAVPTIPLATIATAWTWSAEAFAAFTRNGLTPVMHLHERIDRDEVRRKRYVGQMFHGPDLQVKPIAAGVLGKAYLAEAGKAIDRVSTTSWPAIVATEQRMSRTLAAGGHVYATIYSHAPPAHFSGLLAGDPGFFPQIKKGTSLTVAPGQNDYVLAIAIDWEPTCERWIEPDKMRAAGGLTYLVAGFNTRPQDLRPTELLIDHQAPPGDAIVDVPGYDIRICPISAVTTEAIVWSLTAQLLAEYPRVATKPSGQSKTP